MRATVPDWADGMNHVPCAQVESRRDAALAGRASHAGPHFRDRDTRVIQLASRGPMNSAIHASTAEHLLIRRVDDGVNIKLGDVAPNDVDQGRKSGRATGMPGHGMEMIISTSAMP